MSTRFRIYLKGSNNSRIYLHRVPGYTKIAQWVSDISKATTFDKEDTDEIVTICNSYTKDAEFEEVDNE